MISPKNYLIRKSVEQRGATLVEFALVGLLFFTLLFGIIEFGLLLFNQQVITNAGREGARYGIVARPIIKDKTTYKIDTEDIRLKVKSFAEQNIVSFGDKNFIVDPVFKSGSDYCQKFRDELTVAVSYDYSFLFLPFSKKTLGTTATMICE